MIDPLVVDPSRLESAGTELQGVVFPVLPSSVVATGKDSVSSALNETLPIIESPVIDGLPAIKTAVARTGSNITAAAQIYADTDQRLVAHVSQVQLLAASESPVGGASADRAQYYEVPQAESTPIPGLTSPLTPSAAQIGQVAQTAGFIAPTVMGTVGSISSSAAATPAQPASDSTKTEQSDDDQAGLIDEEATDQDAGPSEALAEGAAASDQALPKIPVQFPTQGRQQTAPSAVSL